MSVLYIYACNTMLQYSQYLPMSTCPTTASLPAKVPKWCALPENTFCRFCFKALCIVAISKSSVEHWEELRTNPKDEKWESHKKMVLKRFENMNITVGLVLTTSAVFISTAPPKDALPYASHASYMLETFSFVAALISLVVGTFVVIIYDPCYAHKDILGSFKKSRTRLICCLVLMAFPSLALLFSIVTLMIALFSAGFASDKAFVRSLMEAICAIVGFLIMLAIYVFMAHMRNVAHPNAEDTPEEPA
ncbi:hypothetical protein C8R48DRAFT_114051 [Suillus tomentosus]|nr:hypothetical protein C8R48DRAFT_114051 [Suillus tomentosus]